MNTSDKQIKVLYVDDEENNLLAFQASFRRRFQIFTASSAAESMKILSEHEVHVIISDQRMPITTGVDFFKIVRAAFPDPTRILITGYSDIEVIIEAINSGEIFRYIKKPWDEYELQTAIYNAYEIYQTRKQLKSKVVELQKTNDELNRFVYSTSHDLRSPLASVLGVLNLAKMEKSVIDPNDYMGMIETCVNKMDAFILKIIEYYKSIRVDEYNEDIDFAELFQDSIDLCRIQNPKIEFDISIDQQDIFKCDGFRLAVIMNNLISNAVKYQRPGESHPVVRLSVVSDTDFALIKIEDNGIGILEEHLNSIFKMFFRSTSNATGVGIGLYIVKEALARIGGDISVHSKFGEGTVFELKIPNQLTSQSHSNFEIGVLK
ncbi:MAG: hybrid sensor histidine kinase/response regulator [Chitinophagaceae bacterium]|nr:hybrid sensor histidine kinase/response regulator [Chitinophagaceae bacterium]